MEQNTLNKLAIKMFGWSFEWLLISERNAVLREVKRRRAAGKGTDDV